MRSSVLAVLLVWLAAGGSARADEVCRSVDVTFQPIKQLQIAVWIEDGAGHYVDTAFVTRLIGTFGLGNRPGNHFLHSAPRFPYGRRDMALPVWAHARNHAYGFVVMGGSEGNSMASCANPGDCDDNTIAFHAGVSSYEPFYCSPSGLSPTDAVSCASPFIGSKGAYAGGVTVSYYPPRADLTAFTSHDSADAHGYAAANDLGAVSGATPQTGMLLDPPISWRPPADGSYVLKVELSQESDFNSDPANQHPENVDDQTGQMGYDFNLYGTDFLGQPSVVYAVPFTVGDTEDDEITSRYVGYGDWDGATGTLHPPDGTISDAPGTGAGRLLDASDGGASFRVRVRAHPSCGPITPPPAGDGGASDGGSSNGGGGCVAPSAPSGLMLTPHANSFDVRFAAPSGPVAAARFDVRYRETPIGEADFNSAIPSNVAPPPPGAPGAVVATTLSGLLPQKSYYVAVRAYSACNAPSPLATSSGSTGAPTFAVLHGCFIATAAYGSPMAAELDTLRAVRDRALLTNPLGRLAVAGYYALSPPIARAIASDDRLRAGVRALLSPLVAAARAGRNR